MPEPFFTGIAYCNRCDRPQYGFSPVSQEIADQAALANLEAHVVKHPDYVPELHSEIDE